MKDDEMEVTVQVRPTQGHAASKKVKVNKTGASLGQVLDEAGIDHKRKDLKVDGQPANQNTHVGPGAKITVSERARGS
ncbi:MAG: hypothetical protein A3J46_00535 [Candidatus Yanofskybacteria bacterium RIFCSPHIGHO2_02_FULL_41_11]|uniref:Ubiquitin-like domain-containing protein n=1 Tax=Candidatus Yanofskybacteria bacterium RIFCSPHIGHO2_02_FULL_41_11 TaxID=1802675 RepID=A0A1F8FC69_9BACT|nr:MAG: hypothetical protein A3J46_00535 [Candidatus Yanofskybacteria bacterium RIFCSPHIGHO2_02_FULL_41_11]